MSFFPKRRSPPAAGLPPPQSGSRLPQSMSCQRLLWSLLDPAVSCLIIPPMILQIPDSLAVQSGCSSQEMLFGLAVGLFMDGRLTLGQAGDALGLSKPDFMELLGQRGIPMPYDEADLESDLKTLRRLFPKQLAMSA
ncbi:MAG TPA: hypothetical protein DDZ88_08235 [Verrucomicrobiales bacterium]|nr:hypothetical protein [Verrucomicrobiales bacterium]